eukprot:jgi/Chrzof1/5972/Cz16g22070.t1
MFACPQRHASRQPTTDGMGLAMCSLPAAAAPNKQTSFIVAVLVLGFRPGLGAMLQTLHGAVGHVCDWAVLHGSCTLKCNQITK